MKQSEKYPHKNAYNTIIMCKKQLIIIYIVLIICVCTMKEGHRKIISL